MNILFLSSIYPEARCPVRGTFNRETCRALSSLHDVRVVAPQPWTERFRHGLGVSGTDEDFVPAIRPTYYYLPKLLRSEYGRMMSYSIRHQVRKLCRDFRPDWVLSYWAHPDGEAGLRIAREYGCRSAVIVGGSDVLLLTKNSRRCRRIQTVLRESDLVFTVCDGLRDRVIELGAAADQVFAVQQGIDRDVFCRGDQVAARRTLSMPDGIPVFVWVGRMVGLKRLDLLVDAFARVRREQPHARLYLLGHGPERDAIRARVKAAGLASAVFLPGSVPHRELPVWFRAASATVLTSDSEGLPNVLRESLASGTPWVSTNAGSVWEISDPAFSIITPCGDLSALTTAMTDILQPTYAAAARQADVRSWSDMAIELTGLMLRHGPVVRPAPVASAPPLKLLNDTFETLPLVSRMTIPEADLNQLTRTSGNTDDSLSRPCVLSISQQPSGFRCR